MVLCSAHCVSNLNKSGPFKVGDIVLLHEDKQPRHMWKMGWIQDTFMGRDGNVTPRAVRRSVQLLYPLDERWRMQVHQAEVC